VLSKHLSPGQQKLVMAMDPVLYPATIPIQDTYGHTVEELDMSDHFALKGTDLPGWPGNRWASRKKRMTVLGFPSAKVLVGHHLDASLEAAKEYEAAEPQQGQQEGQQKGQQKSQQKGQHKSQQKGKSKVRPDVKKTSAPLKSEDLFDTVKVAWHLDSQFPNIEVAVPADSTTNRLISTRIFTQHLDRVHIHDLSNGIVTRKIGHIATDGFNPTPYRNADGSNVQPQASIMEQIDALTRYSIQQVAVRFTKQAERVWEGISEVQLAKIRKNPNPNSVRDQLIVSLDHAQEFCFYFATRAPGSTTAWNRLMEYARRLFEVTKQAGNFWWYRACCVTAGFTRDELDKVALPSVDDIMPRE
jgi:hypothetical protein